MNMEMKQKVNFRASIEQNEDVSFGNSCAHSERYSEKMGRS